MKCSVGLKNQNKTNRHKRALAGLPKKTDKNEANPEWDRPPPSQDSSDGADPLHSSQDASDGGESFEASGRAAQANRDPRPGYRRIFAYSVSGFMK